MEEKRNKTTYSEHRGIHSKSLEGLFSPTKRNPEEDVLIELTKGSKYKPSDIVAIGFKKLNSPNDFEIDELYLTMRGFLESDHPRYESNYQKLKAKTSKLMRLMHHLSDSRITKITEPRQPDKPNNKPFPYYIELDKNSILALYITT